MLVDDRLLSSYCSHQFSDPEEGQEHSRGNLLFLIGGLFDGGVWTKPCLVVKPGKLTGNGRIPKILRSQLSSKHGPRGLENLQHPWGSQHTLSLNNFAPVTF